jgi:hypothetical protein
MVIVLALLTLSTLNGIATVVFRRTLFVSKFPGAARAEILALYLFFAVLILVSLAGIWFRQTWGLWLVCGVAVGTIVLDLVAHGPLFHVIAGPLSLGLILWSVWGIRQSFQ